MIDIIIPAFNAHETVEKTLSSIVIQTFIDEVKVCIVNDKSDKNYEEFVSYYNKFFPIKEIVLEKNRGPGIARQVGIDNTREEFMTFIDADDVFSDALSIQKMMEKIQEDNNCVMVSTGFLEQNEDNTFVTHINDIVWMFGKIYRRSFIKKNKIKFRDSRSNEDLGFNLRIKLKLKNREAIQFFPEFTYLWRFKEDSITRINNANYSFYEGFLGVIDNKLSVLKEEGIEKEVVRTEAVSALIDFYLMGMETRKHRSNNPEYFEHIMKDISVFYKEVGREALENTPQDLTEQIFKERSSLVIGLIPEYTFYNYLQKLEEILSIEENPKT